MSTDNKGVIRFWKLQNGRKQKIFRKSVPRFYEDDFNVSSLVRYTDDGKKLISTSLSDPYISVWNANELSKSSKPRKLKLKYEFIQSNLQLSPDGTCVATYGDIEGMPGISIFDIDSNKKTRTIIDFDVYNRAFVFSKDSRELVVYWKAINRRDKSQSIRYWNVDTGKMVRKVDVQVPGDFSVEALEKHSSMFLHKHAIAFSKDASRVATISKDNQIIISDTMTGKMIKRFPTTLRGVMLMEYSPSGKLLAVAGGKQNDIQIWNVSAE